MSKYYIHCKTQDEWNDILKIYATLISKHKEKDKGFKENDYSRHCESTIFEIDLKNPEYCYYGHKNTYLRDPIYKQKDIIALEQFYQLHPEYQKKQNKKEMKEQILKILEKTYSNESLRKKTVPLFMSDPGLGKTTIIQEFIEEFVASKGLKMVSMILPNLMPNEAVGGVYPNQITKVWEYYDSEKLANLKDGDVLFLDEVFNGTLKQTLDAMLNVLGERRLGSGKKMADVMIVAASNPQGLISLTPQIKERFIKYDLTFNATEFCKYLKDKYLIPENLGVLIANLVTKEKFEIGQWNYHSARSLDKAINQIALDADSPYYDFLLPILSKEIPLPCDLGEKKKGENYPFIDLLKAFATKENEVEKVVDGELVKVREKLLQL